MLRDQNNQFLCRTARVSLLRGVCCEHGDDYDVRMFHDGVSKCCAGPVARSKAW